MAQAHDPEPGGASRDGDPRAEGSPDGQKAPDWVQLVLYAAMMGFALLWFSARSELGQATVSYSDFRAKLAAGELESCVLREESIRCTLTEAARGEGGERIQAVPLEDSELVADLEAAGIEYRAQRPNPLFEMLSWLLPFVLLIGFWVFVLRRSGAMGAPGASLLGFSKSRAKLVAVREVGVTFDDVAGCDEAKQELLEVVDFLKRPERYEAVGAKIPHGVLLVGPPGTGKTLMARAVAGEAQVPFFSISGSDFVEMFVGVGAARVRDLFVQAKEQAPCIVFIDELDAVGRRRGVHLAVTNDERENTLNQLLVELDGFERNAGVILLSATNRPDVLDPALLRPGRFDRQIVLDAPDAQGREAILKVHTRKLPLDDSVDLARIARSTPGFSGADIANAVNEAALLTARRGATVITQQDLDDAIEKVVAGPERKSHRLGGEAKRRVAYHEAGHALVAHYAEAGPEVRKLSIVPRGRAALGYTLQLPASDADALLATRGALEDRLRGLLAGRASEELAFGEPSTGAENDLQQATALARQLVCHFGMGEAAGLMHCARDPAEAGMAQSPLGITVGARDCSDATAREIDREVISLLAEAHEEALKLLDEHRNELDALAGELLVRETIDGSELESILAAARAGGQTG